MTDFAKLILDADTTGLKKGEKALKDLGKQSQETANEVDSNAYKMGESVGKFAKMGFLALGAAATAAAGTLVIAGRQALIAADEMMKTSQALNMNIEAFQRAAYAARTVGIESEKLGDIYKDVNDKMGEFLATGGGELKDFFENIAPKVGVTADAFRGLNGADALQLYVTSLEKAGVNTQQMTFYMEALANDASRLAPILADNGTKFKSLGDEAQRLGIIIDEQTGKAAQEFNVNMMRLGGIMEGLTMRVMADLLPQLISMQEWLIANQDALVKVAGATGKLVSDILTLAGGIIQAANAINNFFAPAVSWINQNVPAMSMAIQMSLNPLRGFIDLYNRMRNAQSGGDSTNTNPVTGYASQILAELRATEAPLKSFGMAASSAGAALGKGLGGGAKAANDNIKPMRDQMQSAMDTLAQFKREMQASGLFTPTQDKAGVSAIPRILGQKRPDQNLAALTNGMINLEDKLHQTRMKSEEDAKAIAESFRTMATDALAALDRLAAGIESGNFLSILSGVVDIGLQLGGMGVFGKETQANILSSRGRANGGSVSAGRAYVVGENRPEVFIPDTNGRIQPSVGSGGGQVIVINNSALADVYVDGRVQAAAPAIVSASANYTQSTMARRSTRRVA